VSFRTVFAFAAGLGARLALAGVPSCPAWDGLPAANISIPAQPLSQALQALAAQTGLDILFEPATVAGLRGMAVRGQMKPADALCLLLKDLGLVYTINADRTVVISRRAGGSPSTSRSHPDPPVVADGSSRSGAGREPTEQVVVTGTRRNDRSAADSPVPVDLVGGESLRQTGSADLGEALSVLVPGLNFPQPSLTDGTDVIRPATLRGLGPDQMLVLVNGKRRHVSALLNINSSVGRGTAAVDLSLLPAAAIERVEVLRDGAAAQYGSDAIAGVINLLLKKQRAGGSVDVSFGERDSVVAGVPRSDRVRVGTNGQPLLTAEGVYALQYGPDRAVHDGQNVTLSGNWGVPLGTDGFLNVSAQARDQQPTNRAGYDPRPQYPPTPAGLADTRELTFDRLSQHFGEPRLEDVTTALNAGLPIVGGELEWYAFGTFGARRGMADGFYRMADDPRTVTQLFPNGFLAEVALDLRDEALATGVRGALDGWSYDLSLNSGRNAIDFRTLNSNNASLGAASPTSFHDGGLLYQQYSANLDVQRDFSPGLLSRDSSLAWGLELRNEQFAMRAGEPASYEQGPILLANGEPAAAGAQVFPGLRPENATDHGRHSSSVYVDLEQSLTSRWSLELAVRAEHYSDFGSTINYKAAARFALADGLALRGAVSTGFRAPSLHQQYFSATSTNNIGGRLFDVGTFSVNDGVAKALGARSLRPETSRSLGGGIVFDRLAGLTLTLDGYRILIDDRIVLTENLGTDGTPEQNAAVQGLLARAGYGSISGARFFINGIDTRTDGVDAVASYKVPARRWGELNLTAGYNRANTRITRYIDDLDPLAEIPGLVLFGALESKRVEAGQPGSRLNLMAQWRRDAWSAMLRTNRYGQVLAAAADPRDDQVLAPAWVTDIQLRYAPSHLQFTLGVDNLLDRYPTAAPTGARPAGLGGYYNVNNHILPFSVFSPFGFSGRYVYAGVGLQY
jgi:iron complex outermembrane recepter protein